MCLLFPMAPIPAYKLVRSKLIVCICPVIDLSCPNIGPSLKTNHGISVSSDLFLGEVPLVPLGHLGPNAGPLVLGVQLGQSAEGVETEHHLGEVPPLKQVCGLKQLLGGDSILPGSTEEGLDILHEHEGSSLNKNK